MKTTLLILAAAFAFGAEAQFEVATVKRNTQSDPRVGRGPSVRNGRFMAGNLTLKTLVSYGFDIPEFRIKGPEWLETEHFDIAAKLPDGSPDAQAKPMLRTLLEDRFHLKTHRDTAEMNVYALVVGKNGSKLKEIVADEPVEFPDVPSTSAMMMTTGPLSDFAARLAPMVGRPVVDKTGIRGNFRVFLIYASGRSAAVGDATDPGPDVFTAIQDQLGLKLEAQKGPVETLVVDGAEKTPEEN